MYNNISLSFIFPLFNEENRLPRLLKKINKFNRFNKNYEFIFVNDGSDDLSLKIITNFLKKNNNKNYKVVSYKKNMGKGFALKMGVKQASKRWLLTIDPDLSVGLGQVNKWFKNYIVKKDTVYFGSRNHKDSVISVKKYRKFIGRILNIMIKVIFSKKISYIKDTQCGFKLYHSEIAKKIFQNLSTFNFAHDIEILSILHKKKIQVKELPVKWKHFDGSKINILYDSIIIFISLFRIKKKYF